MANIKKNFNFRNGVQVDDDNLLVTATGLVGIGTTVPTEALDVRGNVKIVGDATITNATVGILTLTEVVPTQIIGAGVSIKSGIITAQGAGIVTFYGDARFLQGMPTSQWEDTNAGLGVSSIYNTGGTVGIATTNPQFALQVGENPNQIGGVSGRGVGISSVGNINASGIISATTFKGSLSGDVVGNVTGAATRVTLTNQVGDSSCNVLFAQSATGNQLPQTNPNFTFDATNATLTATNFVGNLTGNISGTAANLSGTPNILINNLNVSGISTFNGDILFVGDNSKFVTWDKSDGRFEFFDDAALMLGSSADFEIIHSNNESIIRDTRAGAASTLAIGSDKLILRNKDGNEKYLEATDNGSVKIYNDFIPRLETNGIGVTITSQLDTTNIVASGIITASTELNSPLIGVGTDAPANPIQVRSAGNTEIQITSDTGVAGLTVGREPSTGNTNNAEFRYGGGLGATYSSDQSLDIINYGIGNFNYHLSAANAGNVDGDFHWHKGINSSRLMTLTGIGGSLGIGITDPSSSLHVIGQATISGNVVLGGDLDVTGNAALNVIGQVTGDLTGNVNATTGVSTFKRLDLDTTSYYEFGELSAAGVGIGTTMGTYQLAVNDDADKKFFITDSGNVGIRTDDNFGNELYVSGDVVLREALGVGTTLPTSVVDFSNAGQGLTGAKQNRMFMVPPKVTNAQRGNLTGLVSGAMIYNTNLNKLQVYNGSAWETITSS